jgi:hypothetical protein
MIFGKVQVQFWIQSLIQIYSITSSSGSGPDPDTAKSFLSGFTILVGVLFLSAYLVHGLYS